MPSVQAGGVRKERSGRWPARYYDEKDKRRYKGGFATKTAAREWLDGKTNEVAALRRGDLPTIRRQNMPTLVELVGEYLDQHNAEANTLRTLAARLLYATEGPALDGKGGFAAVRLDRLSAGEIGAWRKRLPERSAWWHIHKALRSGARVCGAGEASG
jgi:hypothetical protein